MWKVESALVPLDGSPKAKYALGIARAVVGDPSQIHLVHALAELEPHLRHVLFPYAPLGEDEPAILDELRRAAAHHVIERLGLSDAQSEMLDVHFGRCADVILNAITHKAIDLVVVNAFAHEAHPNALGSVTQRLLRSSPVPVWVARDPDGKKSVESIVVATDLTRPAAHVLDVACVLAMQLGASLEVVHVIPDPFVQDDHELLKASIRLDKKQLAQRSRDRIDALFERALEPIKPAHPDKEKITQLLSKRRILIGRPHVEVLKAAEDADLLIVGRQSPHPSTMTRLGSVADQIARQASCDVLVVPVNAEATLAEDQ
jgi:nucleotide-binding universal stress UspA family protein